MGLRGHPEISSLSLIDPIVNIDGVWQKKTGYEPNVLEDLASDFIQDTPADQPFFVMYTPTTPHLPADDPTLRGHARLAARGDRRST